MEYRLTKIDELIREDHYYLDEDDDCYYVMEYTSGGGFEFSETNSLIHNLKKSVEKRGAPGWKYKAVAIAEVASIFRRIISAADLAGVTIVPMPSSKCKSDPHYDDRLNSVLVKLCDGYGADIRALLFIEENIIASHESGARPKPEYFEKHFKIDSKLCDPTPKKILIFDDMITVGTHFKAAKNVLSKRFPDASIRGIFIARRAISI